jgi:hypothetical protein
VGVHAEGDRRVGVAQAGDDDVDRNAAATLEALAVQSAKGVASLA